MTLPIARSHCATHGGLHGLEGPGADHVEDRERREVDDAGRLPHPQVLGVDDRGPPAGVPLVLARHHPVAVLRHQGGVGLVPERALPAGGLEEHRALLDLLRVHRGEPLAAVGLVLLAGVDDPVGLVERLRRARPDVGAGALVRVEPGDVGVADVDLGVTVRHPLGDRAADPRALLDPDRGRGPEALDLGRLPQHRPAVGGQREQPVDRVADLGAVGTEQVGHQLEGLLQLRVEVLLGERHLRRRQLGLLDRGDVLGVPQDRAVGVGADLHVGAVLALVAEGVHVADDREGDLAGLTGELRAGADARSSGAPRGSAGSRRRPSGRSWGSTRRRR